MPSRRSPSTITASVNGKAAAYRVCGAPDKGSERESVRLVAHREPLPLGELIPAALRPEPRSVPGSPRSPEGGERIVVQCLVVDVHDASRQLIGDGAPARSGSGLDGGDQPVLGVVRHGNGLRLVPDDDDRGDRAEDLL